MLRAPDEAAREYTRDLMNTEGYRHSRTERKKIERLFGEVKRHLGLTRLRLRGLSDARDEFLLAATVQNLKRLVSWRCPFSNGLRPVSGGALSWSTQHFILNVKMECLLMVQVRPRAVGERDGVGRFSMEADFGYRLVQDSLRARAAAMIVDRS